MPIPPSPANVIAIFDSVTVSIAADKIGILRLILLVNFVVKSTSSGSILENCGTRSTSSKANPSLDILSLKYIEDSTPKKYKTTLLAPLIVKDET